MDVCDLVGGRVNPVAFQGVGMTSKRTRDRLVQRLLGQGITDQCVLDVMANTPRHLFLDEALSHRAYEDTSLPIGFGQTLSQPYIVARMTEVLLNALGAKSKQSRVLEVGTGSGYQTSILAQLVQSVLTVERIRPLQDKARTRLRLIGLNNVQYKHGDGGLGWPAEGVFDGILCAAAPRTVPKSLLDQLAPNGVLIIPVGGDTQELTLIVRQNDSDNFMTKTLEPVKFVPLLAGVTV